MDKKVYIIILNYRGYEDTKKCINSCLALNYSNYKIVVIDNYYENKAFNDLKNDFKYVKFLKNIKNLGYAKANNIAIKCALDNDAEYIWILNNDIVVDKYSLDELVKAYENTSNVGLMGSKVINSISNKIDYVGGIYNDIDGSTVHIARDVNDLGQYDNKLIETDFVTGCSVFASANVINNIGLIPEKYFLYYEDVDWSLTARKLGYIQIVNTNSVVYHKCSSSTKEIKGLITFYITRNRLFLLQKYCSDNTKWIIRFKQDINKFFHLLMNFNLRACFNMLIAYVFWLLGLGGKRESPEKIMPK